MVRLKGLIETRRHPLHFSFNPTVVRLKVVALAGEAAQITGFNPTVVRLKDADEPPANGGPKRFNPTVVRLKVA